MPTKKILHCRICKRFFREIDYDYNKKMCKKCVKSFNIPQQVYQKPPSPPLNSYKCNHCGINFNSAANLFGLVLCSICSRKHFQQQFKAHNPHNWPKASNMYPIPKHFYPGQVIPVDESSDFDEVKKESKPEEKPPDFGIWFSWRNIWMEVVYAFAPIPGESKLYVPIGMVCPFCTNEIKPAVLTKELKCECTNCGALKLEQWRLEEDFDPKGVWTWGISVLTATGNWVKGEDYMGWEKGQTCTVSWDAQIDHYRIKMDIFKGLKDLVGLIKAYVPSSHRSYDPKTHTWFIEESYLDILEPILKSKFYTYTKMSREEVEKKYKEFQWNHAQSGNGASGTGTTPEQDMDTFISILTKVGIGSEYNDRESLDKADKSIILKLYRRAALVLHPDRNPEGAEDMSKLNAAFENLKVRWGLKKVEA